MFPRLINLPARRWFLLGLLITLLVILLGCSSGGVLSEGDPAPDFSLPSSTGEIVSLAQVTENGPALLFFHMAQG